jgi:predicted transcriptional regulator
MASAVSKPARDDETSAERDARLERMRAFLNEGLADIAAGRFIEGDRWLESEIAEAEDAAR